MKINNENKTLVFLLILFFTILFVRIGVLIKDPNPILFGYEWHHFHYGVLILIISNLFLLFNHKYGKSALFLSAIGIGLIIDEFVFILGQMDSSQYYSTVPSVVLFLVIMVILSLLIEKFSKK